MTTIKLVNSIDGLRWVGEVDGRVVWEEPPAIDVRDSLFWQIFLSEEDRETIGARIAAGANPPGAA
jgi:hypothetical protein